MRFTPSSTAFSIVQSIFSAEDKHCASVMFSADSLSMRNVGVLWGFGGREELQAAGAGALAATPDELAAVLRG